MCCGPSPCQTAVAGWKWRTTAPASRPEELPHLFDRYYRARQDAGKTGTGLGLSITKAILQQHDFPFGVNSTVGKGSTFWFEMKAPQ